MITKSLTQFLKTAKGMTLTLIRHDWLPESHAFLNVPRKVQDVRSKCVVFENGSELSFMHSQTVKFIDDLMIIDLNNDGAFTNVMVYKRNGD